MKRKRWLPAEDAELLRLRGDGMTLEQVAAHIRDVVPGGRGAHPRRCHPDGGGGMNIESPFLTAVEAARFLNIAYGTFRKVATRIKRCRHGRYHVDDLLAYARSPGRARVRRSPTESAT